MDERRAERAAINARMYARLYNEGQYQEDVTLLGKLRDIRAAETFQGDLMPKEEFCALIGVEVKPDGNFDLKALINTCLGIQDLGSVRALPQDQRVRAVATAVEILSRAFPG